MDKIFVHGLRVEATIGVHRWERQLPRPLLIDLDLQVDTRAAAASDAVADAVDYAAVAALVTRVATEQQPALLETLADALARALFEQFAIQALRLAVHKPGAVAGVKSVGVEIERRREDYAA